MRSWFAEGRSIAIQRTKARTAGLDRGLYRLARVAVAPFHAAAHLLAALFLLPVNPFKAAGHFFQVCRNCGFASQLLLEAVHGTESQK